MLIENKSQLDLGQLSMAHAGGVIFTYQGDRFQLACECDMEGMEKCLVLGTSRAEWFHGDFVPAEYEIVEIDTSNLPELESILVDGDWIPTNDAINNLS